MNLKHRSRSTVLAATAASLLVLVGALLFAGAPLMAADADGARGRRTLSVRNVVTTVEPRPIANKFYQEERGTSDRYRFLTDEDADVIGTLEGFRDTISRSVVYLRRQEEIERRAGEGDRCDDRLQVLAWLTEKVNARGGTLMVAYGPLIRLHREGDLVDPAAGAFHDDDLDLWASLDTFEMIASLEPVVFERFGWSLRMHANGPYLVLMQMFSACGHAFSKGKATPAGANVGIEVYALPSVPLAPGDGGYPSDEVKYRDIWAGHSFPASMIHPARGFDLRPAGSDRTLHLQVPNRPRQVLRCVYGDWETPYRGGYYQKFQDRRSSGTDCTDYYDSITRRDSEAVART